MHCQFYFLTGPKWLVNATVITHDAQDFTLLRRYLRFELHILS